MLIFGTIGLVRTYIPLSSGLIACFRGFVGALFLLIFMLCTGRKLRIRKDAQTLASVISGALIGFNWMLLFEAMKFAGVPVATLCYYMEPTIVILLSAPIFAEKLTPKKLICAAVSLFGMVLVSGIFEDASGSWKGIILGLAAAAVYSAVVLVNKRFPSDDAYSKTFIQLASAAVAVLPYVLITEDFSAIEITWPTALLLLTAGIVHTGIAYLLYFASMPGLPAQSIALLSYVDPASALILSGIFLGQTLSVWGIVGAVLILGAAFVGEVNLSRKKN